MGKNIRSLQLLRNTTLFNDKATAIAGIQSGATNDGTVKLARYSDSADGGKVKTVFGICYNPTDDTTSGATGFSYTIYDSPQEVITALKGRIKTNEDAIDVLNGVDTVEGSVAKKIKDAIAGLNATIDSTGGTFVDVQVVETDGKITGVTVKENNIASADLLGTTADTASATTAFGYIAKEAADRDKAITTAINTLDVEDTAVTGEYVSAVSETDGKIAVTRAELPTVAEIKSDGQAIIAVKEDKGVISATAGDITAAHVTIADASNHFSATTVEAALDELFSKAGDGSKVTVESADNEGGFLKVYTIKQGGEEVGKINIPKDLVVTSGSVVKGTWDGNTFTPSESGTGTALKLVIANQDAPVYINTLDLVKDHTAGNGIAISDTNVVSVKIATDSDSESFLTVDENGVKLSGVQTAINTAANKAATEVVEDAAGHVTVTKTTGDNGQAIYTIGENDIASANLLGTTASTSGETSAFGYIAKEVAERKAAIQAQKDALDAEIAARKAVDGINGDAYTAKTNANYISGANSLFDADVKLDAAIKTEETARKTEDAKIVAGVGFSSGNTYLIAANTGTGASVTAASTVKDAIYTLDNALAAAKTANALTAADKTVVVDGNNGNGTTVKVNIATAETVTNFVGYAADGSFIKSAMFGTIDAGTY